MGEATARTVNGPSACPARIKSSGSNSDSLPFLLLQYEAEDGHGTGMALGCVIEGCAPKGMRTTRHEAHVVVASGVQLSPNEKRPSVVGVHGSTRHLASISLECGTDDSRQLRANSDVFVALRVEFDCMPFGNRPLKYFLPVVGKL